MSGLGSISSCILQIITGQWPVLVVLVLELCLEVCRGEIGDIVPGVILSGLIDLVQRIFRWVDLGGSLLSGVSSNVA